MLNFLSGVYLIESIFEDYFKIYFSTRTTCLNVEILYSYDIQTKTGQCAGNFLSIFSINMNISFNPKTQLNAVQYSKYN